MKPVSRHSTHLYVQALQVSGVLACTQLAYGEGVALLQQAYDLCSQDAYGCYYFGFGRLVQEYVCALVAVRQVCARVCSRILCFFFVSISISISICIYPAFQGPQ